MKKFLVLTYGFVPPTDEVKAAWGAWFSQVGPHLVDPGNPFGHGVELTSTSRTELTLSSASPLVGYCILSADDLEHAEALVSSMPIIESVRIYEAQSMWPVDEPHTEAIDGQGRAHWRHVLAHSSYGSGSAETARAYLPRLARFVNWCDDRHMDPLALTKDDLARYRG